ncbi:MAG: tyrosine-protein phosphatase [Streptomycetaceae bacterium]|nr:tyrosine-protein phosphatase [Streptomycetaceae bacterium]
MTTLDSVPARGLANLRDIGGLPTEAGGTTRRGLLYRSDVPLAGDAPPDGLEWPPRTVVDLRSAHEQERAPGPFADAGVHLLPLLDAADPAKLGRPSEHGGIDAFMTKLYQEMITHSATLIARLPAIAADAEGPLLIHCTAGRDRTGIAVAVLLRSAGVTRDAVMADYVATSANQEALFPRLAANGFFPKRQASAQGARDFGDTAVAMERVLDRLAEQPGGIRGWLVAHGADEAAIDAWAQRVTE